MNRYLKKVSFKAGASPGTLLHIGEKKQETVTLNLMHYNDHQFVEHQIDSIQQALPLTDTSKVTWIDIHGLHDLDVIRKMGESFGIHPLTLEDILNTDHRPKYESFETYLYVVSKILILDLKTHHVNAEQISFILSKNYLISIQESEGEVFNLVKERIRKNKGKIRKMGCDYLAYALVDAVVDQYFEILEQLGEEIDDIGEGLFDDPAPEILQRLHTLKQEMILLRKEIWPMRDVINGLRREDEEFISAQTLIYLNDVNDHIIHIVDTIESYRDTLSSLMDLYLSFASNRMNEVVKVLTIIATIFIPVTFVAGVYGMNFKFMPEVTWKWGYPAVWIVMIGIAGGMLLYFKKKKWL